MKKESENVLKNLFISLSPVQALSTALPATNMLISSCIIGSLLGESALAAIGFAGPFNYIIQAFASVMAVGSQLVCSRHIGQGNKKGINRTYSVTMFVCVVLGLILTSLSFFFPNTLATLLGATGELRTMTADYLKGYSLCCMGTMLLMSIIPFLQIDCSKTVTTISIVSQIVVTVSLNILNALYLHWGLLGVGIASSAGSVTAVIIGLSHLSFKSKLFTFSFSDISYKELKEIVVFGINGAMLFVWLFFRDRVFNSIAFAMGGTLIISAFTVANNISNVLGNIVQGSVAGPCNIIASLLVGERDVESLRELPKIAIKTVFPVAVLLYVVTFILAKPIVSLFGATSENTQIYVLVLRVFILWFITNPFKSAAISIYSALKKVKEMGLAYFVSIFVIPALLFIIAKATGSVFLLASQAWLAEFILVLVFFVVYIAKTHSFKLSLANYIYISRDFAAPKENILALTVYSEKDAADASVEVENFCLKKGMSAKNSNFSGLCVEELASDTIRRGFGKSKSPRHIDAIDVRLIYENNTLSIMLRDDCPCFNPNEWLKLHDDLNPDGLGLRVVSKIATEIVYSANLGLNTTTIKI